MSSHLIPRVGFHGGAGSRRKTDQSAASTTQAEARCAALSTSEPWRCAQKTCHPTFACCPSRQWLSVICASGLHNKQCRVQSQAIDQASHLEIQKSGTRTCGLGGESRHLAGKLRQCPQSPCRSTGTHLLQPFSCANRSLGATVSRCQPMRWVYQTNPATCGCKTSGAATEPHRKPRV